MMNLGKLPSIGARIAETKNEIVTELYKRMVKRRSHMFLRANQYANKRMAESGARKAAEKEKNRIKLPSEIRMEKEAIQLKRNRRTINGFLHLVGKHIGSDMFLCEEGMTRMTYKDFLVIVNVPNNRNRDRVYIYTTVYTIGSRDNQYAVFKKAMELNFMVTLTKGASLGLEGNEIVLCYSALIANLAPHEFEQILMSFLQLTSPIVRDRLHNVKEASKSNIYG
jgi:Tir chaperone protein (CesT) family